MKADQCNEKYKAYLERGFGGLEFDIPEVTDMLDKEFTELVKKPGFRYSQIKLKFGMARFYFEYDDFYEDEEYRIEKEIDRLITLVP